MSTLLLPIIQIARVAHEVNRAFCSATGDHSQVPWEEAPAWQCRSAIAGVEFHLTHPGASPELSHENWVAHKRREGWVYGPERDIETKQHPCMLPFDELPLEQQVKDHLFAAVVRVLAEQPPL